MGLDETAASSACAGFRVCAAHKIGKATGAVLPAVPFKSLRGMRDRIAHDCGAVDFKIVWAVNHSEIVPLIAAPEAHFEGR